MTTTEHGALSCPKCGTTMNHHANKLVYAGKGPDGKLDEMLEEFHRCPNCGTGVSRRANLFAEGTF